MNDRIKHFKNQVSVLGVTQQVPVNKDQGWLQAQAERYWGQSNYEASKTISEQGARDLVGQTLHHPAMDSIHGIEHLRASFDPQKHVTVVDNLPKEHLGQLESTVYGEHFMRLGQTPTLPLRTHVVTHELSHLLIHPTLSPIQWSNFDKAGGIGHSWAMARMHVHTVRHSLGDYAADELRSIYRAHGVGFGRRNI